MILTCILLALFALAGIPSLLNWIADHLPSKRSNSAPLMRLVSKRTRRLSDR